MGGVAPEPLELARIRGPRAFRERQVCVTPDRFFVHDSLHEAFVEEFANRAKALKLGDGLNDGIEDANATRQCPPFW